MLRFLLCSINASSAAVRSASCLSVAATCEQFCASGCVHSIRTLVRNTGCPEPVREEPGAAACRNGRRDRRDGPKHQPVLQRRQVQVGGHLHQTNPLNVANNLKEEHSENIPRGLRVPLLRAGVLLKPRCSTIYTLFHRETSKRCENGPSKIPTMLWFTLGQALLSSRIAQTLLIEGEARVVCISLVPESPFTLSGNVSTLPSRKRVLVALPSYSQK